MINKSLRSFFLLIAAISNQSVFAVTCEFEITNEWNTGFTSSVILINDTQTSIDGWAASIEFFDGSVISNMWNAELTGQNPFQASDLSYNRIIAPGSSISFGFNSQKLTPGTAAQDPMLGGICDSASNKQPHPVFTASALQGQIPFTVDFNADQSTDPDADELTYLWQFGDASSSNAISPSHTFTEAGIYTVTLTVDDGELNASKSISINAELAEPTAAQCRYLITEEWGSGFTSSIEITNVAEQSIEGWSVSILFPDDSAQITQMWNAELNGQNPYQASNKDYNGVIEPGSIVSFGFNSNKSMLGDSVKPPQLSGICGSSIINHPPQIEATVAPLQGTAPLTVSFDASQSSDSENNELSFFWDFGNGQSSTEPVTTKTFSEAGTYPVSLTVTDSNQASSSKQFTVLVQDPVVNDTYTLDAESSSLFFVSTKNIHIIESHTFHQITGDIAPNGAASILIDLDSVDTGINIRDERLRDVLFETSLFSEAAITLDVDMALIESIQIGESIEQNISPVAALHGMNVALQMQVSITRLSDNTLVVQNLTPILLNAGDFNLVDGIEALRDLAGLNVISYSVPVNFTLIFNKQ